MKWTFATQRPPLREHNTPFPRTMRCGGPNCGALVFEGTAQRNHDLAFHPAAVRDRRAQDFTLGQKVVVDADQGLRQGVVTRIGRTRVSILHPRNSAGATVERSYPLSRIALGYALNRSKDEVDVLWADGQWFPTRHATAAVLLLDRIEGEEELVDD